jgi:hypothetical protein
MSQQEVKLRIADATQSAGLDTGKTDSQPPKPQGPKPTKTLPSTRISFSKKLDSLRAFAAVSGPSNKLVVLKDVADIVKMASSTLTLETPFWVDVKFITKKEGQGFTPAGELMEYAHAHEWNKETAAHKLSPLLADTWFWEALQPRLNFGELTEDEAITILAEKSTAGPECKYQLRVILDYLEAAGMVKRENGAIKMVKSSQHTKASPAAAAAPAGDKATPSQAAEHKAAPLPRSAVTTNFSQPTQGVVQFDVSVRVDMNEFAGWQPARIAAFFNGIAQVLSAKGAVEQESSRE